MSVKYPQHEKLKTVSDKTQFVHDFLTFCEENGVSLQTENGVYQRHDDLLYKFIGVDRWKLEAEKRKMIASIEPAKETKKQPHGPA